MTGCRSATGSQSSNPQTKLTNMQYLDKLIKEFCGDDPLRPAFLTPILDGDNVVASEAHILMVAPKNRFGEVYKPNDTFPKYKDIIPPHDPSITMAEIDINKVMEYYEGIEKMPVYEDCAECEGSAGKNCDCFGQQVDCSVCGGTGQSRNKTGEHIPRHSYCVRIDETFIALDFINTVCKVSQYMNEPLRLVMLQRTSACVFYCSDVMMLLSPLMTSYDNVLAL